MDPENLIEEIRKFPVLYDQTNEKYRNVDYKEQIWRNIASTLQVKGGVEESKKRWASIRDQFLRVLQKRKTSSGQAAARPHKYKYEDILSFLTPYLMERETLSNVSIFQELEERGEETTVEESNIEESSLGEPIVDVEESLIEEPTSKNSIMPTISTQGQFLKPNAKKRKISSRHQQDSPANQLMAYFLAEKKAEAAHIATKEPAMHAVDAFLTGIAPTLKSLSPILLNQVKTKIFSIVQEFELKQLESDLACQEQLSVTTSHSSSPSSTHSYPSPLLVQVGSKEGVYYIVDDDKCKTTG